MEDPDRQLHRVLTALRQLPCHPSSDLLFASASCQLITELNGLGLSLLYTTACWDVGQSKGRDFRTFAPCLFHSSHCVKDSQNYGFAPLRLFRTVQPKKRGKRLRLFLRHLASSHTIADVLYLFLLVTLLSEIYFAR